MFKGFLAIAPGCAACGADFTSADVGDGAAVFVMFVVGGLVTPLAFALQFAAGWPIWATMAAAGLAAIVLSLGLLRPFKGVLFALQWRYHAREATAADRVPPP